MAVVFALFGQHPIERRTSRFSIALPTEATVDPLRGSVAVSPDGTRMIYVTTIGGRQQLAMRTIDRDEPAAVEGTEGASDPFFSPDGNWIGFFARGSLQKVPVTGGVPTLLSAARAGMGATWSRDGTIVFGGGPGGGLARVSASGGEPFVLASPLEGSRDLRYGWPDLLPDGRGIVYTAVSLAGSDVFVARSAQPDANPTRIRCLVWTLLAHRAFDRRDDEGGSKQRPSRWRRSPRPGRRGQSSAASRPPTRSMAVRASRFHEPDRSSMSRALRRASRTRCIGSTDEDSSSGCRSRRRRSAMSQLAPDQRRLAITMDGETGPDLWLGDLTAGALRRLTEGGHSISPGVAARRSRDRVCLQQGRTLQRVPDADRRKHRRRAAAHRVRGISSRRRGHRTRASWRSRSSSRSPAPISGCSTSTRANGGRWSERFSTRRRRGFRLTVDGWPTCRPKAVVGRSTSATPADTARVCRCRPAAAVGRAGR